MTQVLYLCDDIMKYVALFAPRVPLQISVVAIILLTVAPFKAYSCAVELMACQKQFPKFLVNMVRSTELHNYILSKNKD